MKEKWVQFVGGRRVRRRPGLGGRRLVFGVQLPKLAFLAVLGPGLVSGFADNDAGGITTYSIVGAQFGYALLWVVLASMVALFVTQEVGARLGLATGRGLLDLDPRGVRDPLGGARDRDDAGGEPGDDAGRVRRDRGGALAVRRAGPGVGRRSRCSWSGCCSTRAGFLRVQYVFLAVGAGVSVAYVVSAILARPDWGKSAEYLVAPHGQVTSAYLLAVVGTVGTTITPWGQAFIQSYCADKRLTPEHLRTSRFDVALGAVPDQHDRRVHRDRRRGDACGRTASASIPDAAAAAKALGPLAGHAAETVFALGLLGAAFLGLGVVPLTSSYATTEALGLERGLDLRPRQAPAFYGLLAFFLGAAAVLVLIPGLPLIRVMFLAQVVNGLLLPIILVFVMLLSRRRKLLGDLTSGPALSRPAGSSRSWSAPCRSPLSSPTYCHEHRRTPPSFTSRSSRAASSPMPKAASSAGRGSRRPPRRGRVPADQRRRRQESQEGSSSSQPSRSPRSSTAASPSPRRGSTCSRSSGAKASCCSAKTCSTGS